MQYGQFRYYWLALLAGVTGHQMLLNFTMGWLMFELTGEERDLAYAKNKPAIRRSPA